MADNDRIEDRETGLSIRFVREWKPRQGDMYVDLALISCRWLGHMFEDTGEPNEQRCGICGVYKTTISG